MAQACRGALAANERRAANLKIEELVICCKLRVDLGAIDAEEVEGLRRHYAAFHDGAIAPAPVEIARTAVELCHRLPAEDFDVLVREVVAIIVIAEGEAGASLASELRQLRARLSLA